MDDTAARATVVTPAVDAPPSEAPVAAAPPPPPRMSYTPALDGMRAFAIVFVMMTHYNWRGVSLMRTGYLGVDMFFVLSGFLITTLLLAEWERAGHISLRDFYARRALRLLPLLAVVLLVASIIVLTTRPGTPGRPSWRFITATAFYFANWSHLYRPSPEGFLNPAWSLAIEEQFYLIWPIVLIGLLTLGLRRRSLLAVPLIGAAASIVWRHHIMSTPPKAPNFAQYYGWFTFRSNLPSDLPKQRMFRVYFASDTRADMLLVGCALAIALLWLAPKLTPLMRRGINWLGWACALVIALFFADIISTPGNWIENWGAVAFELCVAVVIAAIMLNTRGYLSKFLAIPVLVWIGRRAYGIYLIHQFVYFFIGEPQLHFGVWFGHFGDYLSVVVDFALVFIFAGITFWLIETPALRLKKRFEGARTKPHAVAAT
jgi:peptidoglycan/LPS O-acetylase OafA/YrhL